MAKNGNEILVYMNGVAIAHARSAEVSVDGELVEVGSPTQGDWREFLAGRKEWAVQVGYLVMENSELTKVVQVNQKVQLIINGRSGDTQGLIGTAFIKTAKQTYTRGTLIQGSFAFKGSGPLWVTQD